jgi:hypothetical protein
VTNTAVNKNYISFHCTLQKNSKRTKLHNITMFRVGHYDYRRPLWVFSCIHNNVISLWLPTLNFCGWTERNQKHGLAPMQSKTNFLRCRRGVPASAVDVVENNTTLFIKVVLICLSVIHRYILDVVNTILRHHFLWLRYTLVPVSNFLSPE